MRVCIATPLYPPELGGPATYVRILEEELASRGIEVEVVKFSDVRPKPKVLRHLAYFFAVRRAGRIADRIFALDPVSTGLPAALAALTLGKPFFVKIVGDYAWEQGSQRFGVTQNLDEFVRATNLPFRVRFFQRLETWVARRAHTIIVPSEYLKAIVNAWGITPTKITVVYNAMQKEEPGVLPPAVAALPRPHIATIGRLVPWKGIPGVIDAVTKVRSTDPDASLIIVGDGPDKAELEAYARTKLPEGCIFTGALTHGETLAVLADADIFVLNSTYEGLSHLLIESLTLGTATIATDVGGNPELIRNGENGLLVPVADTDALASACRELLEHPVAAQQLGDEAKKSMSTFSVRAMIEGTEAVLKGAL